MYTCHSTFRSYELWHVLYFLAEIESQSTEMADVERSIHLLQNDMTKLNQLITKNRGQQETLEQGNSLLESDFVQTLKEAELECIQLQTRVSQLKEEKERGKNGLLEAERQILLWERKIQLAKEMRAAVDSEAGKGEITGMKAEIHRMEVGSVHVHHHNNSQLEFAGCCW